MLDLQEEAQGSGIMWWTSPSLNGTTDLLVPPDLLVDVKDHLKSNKIDFDVVIWDLQVREHNSLMQPYLTFFYIDLWLQLHISHAKKTQWA